MFISIIVSCIIFYVRNWRKLSCSHENEASYSHRIGDGAHSRRNILSRGLDTMNNHLLPTTQYYLILTKRVYSCLI